MAVLNTVTASSTSSCSISEICQAPMLSSDFLGVVALSKKKEEKREPEQRPGLH